jgi:hypothetical protein
MLCQLPLTLAHLKAPTVLRVLRDWLGEGIQRHLPRNYRPLI